MKESKEFDKEIDKRFNEELNEIKEKLNAEKLSDEFKANLNSKLQEELNKDDSSKGKIFNFPTISRKLAGMCACFVFLFSSCFVFADDIENVILELFGNTDRIIAKAIEEGNYKDIEMDYVEDQGVSIKVDYIVAQDDELYIAFDVFSEEEFDKVFFNDINIESQDKECIYMKDVTVENSDLNVEDKRINSKNVIMLYKLTRIKYDLGSLKELSIEIKNIDFIKEEKSMNNNGLWKFNINV